MDWFQQALTPAEVIELNLRFGAIPSQDHCQWLVEAKDPMTGILIAQASFPHGRLRDLDDHLSYAAERFRALGLEVIDPF